MRAGGTALQRFCSFLNGQDYSVLVEEKLVQWYFSQDLYSINSFLHYYFNMCMKPLGQVILWLRMRYNQNADDRYLHISKLDQARDTVEISIDNVGVWMKHIMIFCRSSSNSGLNLTASLGARL